MRKLIVALALTWAAAGPALAQSNKGAFAVDAMIAPTTGFGFGYYVTDGLSLRPWLSLGYSGSEGFFGSIGGQVRYEFGAGWTVSPYLSASAQYSYSDNSGIVAPGPYGSRNEAVRTSGGQLGTGAGVRFRIAESFSLFTEGRVIYATYPMSDLNSGWSTFDINEHARGEVVFGLTYLFR